MADRRDRLELVTWGQRVRLLEAAYRAAGGTQKDLAEGIGVSPRTIRRWKTMDERPDTAFGDVGDKFTRRERYYYRERPPRLRSRPEPPSDEIRLAAIPAGESPFGDDDLLKGLRVRAAFDMTQTGRPDLWRRIRSAVRDGKRLTFYLGTAEGIEAATVHTVTIDTDGLNSLQVQRLYFRQVRETLAEAMGTMDLGSDEIDISLLGILPVSH